jgi:RNA polymerase sigma-70 factor (ECF subfamily)
MSRLAVAAKRIEPGPQGGRGSGPDAGEDATLVAAAARGDAAAFRALVDRHLSGVLIIARRMLRDDAEAEDVAQEAMLRLWRVAPDWRSGEAQVSTWLYRVVTNLVTDQRRARARRPAVALDEAPDVADGGRGVVAGLIEADRMVALQRALAALPDRQRQAVVLRHIEGLTNPEIAAIMEIGVEAVESLTARGKRALCAILAGKRAELGYDDAAEGET